MKKVREMNPGKGMSFTREMNTAVERKKKTWAINEGGTHQSAEELLLALAQKITVWNW